MAIRAFIALELPEPIRAALTAAMDAARTDAPGKVSWIPPENLHLTLVFLGASEPEPLAALSASLREIAQGHARFPLTLAKAGAFPQLRRPSVLWIGLEPSEPLAKLQAEIAAACARAGWILEERAFSAHLTCARVKFPGPPNALGQHWSSVSVPAERWEAQGFSLMRSDTRPEGARYTAVERFPLAGSAPHGG